MLGQTWVQTKRFDESQLLKVQIMLSGVKTVSHPTWWDKLRASVAVFYVTFIMATPVYGAVENFGLPMDVS